MTPERYAEVKAEAEARLGSPVDVILVFHGPRAHAAAHESHVSIAEAASLLRMGANTLIATHLPQFQALDAARGRN